MNAQFVHLHVHTEYSLLDGANDCHYLTREEAHIHEVLLCVQTGKTIQDQYRFKFSPDINESDHDFTVVADRIRFGLAAVKNVGGSALDSIMEVRGKAGPFCSLADFCSRVDLPR